MQQLDYNNGRAVFSTWSLPRCYKQDSVVKKADSWKGAAVQRGVESGRRVIVIVRSRYQTKTLRAGKDLACILVICKLWKLAMAL
jgi:hypothetical protein